MMLFLCCLEWPQERPDQTARQGCDMADMFINQQNKVTLPFCRLPTNYHLHTHLSTELTYFPGPNIHYCFVTKLGCRKMLKGGEQFLHHCKQKSKKPWDISTTNSKKRVHLHGFPGCRGRCYFWNVYSPSRGGKAVSGCTHTAGFLANSSAAVHVPKDIPAPAFQQIMDFTFPFTLTTQF